MATPTAVEILMAYLQHAYDGLLAGEEQVVSHPVDQRFNFQNVLRGESFFRELLQRGLVEESGATGIGHIYWLTPSGQGLMEGVPSIDAAIRHAAGAKPPSDLIPKVRSALLLELIRFGIPRMDILVEKIRYLVTIYSGSQGGQ